MLEQAVDGDLRTLAIAGQRAVDGGREGGPPVGEGQVGIRAPVERRTRRARVVQLDRAAERGRGIHRIERQPCRSDRRHRRPLLDSLELAPRQLVAALGGLGAERRIVVILGGEGKGQDFSPLAMPVSRYVRAAVLIGRDGPQIRAALRDAGVPLVDAATLPDAVRLAAQRAHAGDAVLMSPACASFDMFRNYEHRAEVFREAVQALAEEAGQALEGGLA